MGHLGRTLVLSAVISAVLLGMPSAGSGQTAGELQHPRNNVQGGAVSARSPGNWINRGISNHVERQNTSLYNYGGATLISEDQATPSRRQVMTLAFLQGLFDFLTQLGDQLLVAIEASKQASSGT